MLVNGVRLFFDVEGASLVPDGPALREKPTLVLLHGGPGLDHSIYKPLFSKSGGHRPGRVPGPSRQRPQRAGAAEDWTLAQWGDDVHAFCEALGIPRPIVHGHVVRRHGRAGLCDAPPGASRQADPGEHRGRGRHASGAASGALRALRVDRRSARWRAGGSSTGTRTRPRSRPGCVWPFPVYTRTTRDPDVIRRAIRHPEVTRWFTRRGGEGTRSTCSRPWRAAVSDPRHGRGGRSDDAHRVSGGHRGGPAGAPRPLRAVSGVRARG